MSLTLITGAVRSGKSIYAETLAQQAGNDNITYVATLDNISDDLEMRSRITDHQSRRNPNWQTVELPIPSSEIRITAGQTILVDCIGGWVSNILCKADLADTLFAESTALSCAQINTVICGWAKSHNVYCVTNEVGWSVVPPYPLGRKFRDELGTTNQSLAAIADTVILMAVGIPLTIKPTPSTH